jgi:hypothetical protein
MTFPYASFYEKGVLPSQAILIFLVESEHHGRLEDFSNKVAGNLVNTPPPTGLGETFLLHVVDFSQVLK